MENKHFTMRLTTLTPLHIGSGENRLPNIDYLIDEQAGKVYLPEPGLFFAALEEAGILEDYIALASGWAEQMQHAPDRERYYRASARLNVLDKVLAGKKLRQHLPPLAELSRAVLPFAQGDLPRHLRHETGDHYYQELRGHIRNLQGSYLPGSSLKGALRTALLGKLACESPESTVAEYYKKSGKSYRKGESPWTAAGFEKIFFGGLPYDAHPEKAIAHDPWRILQIPDLALPRTEVYRSEMLNVRGLPAKEPWEGAFHDFGKGHWDLKQQGRVWMEGVAAGQQVTFGMRWRGMTAQEQKNLEVQCGSSYPLRQEKQQLLQPEQLLSHALGTTRAMLGDDLDFMDQVGVDPGKRQASDLLNRYFEKMEWLEEEAEACTPGKSAVLRLGFGSGYRFITGDWLDWKALGTRNARALSTAVRQNDRHGRYQYIQPAKSRRLLADGSPLGFVKVEILEA